MHPEIEKFWKTAGYEIDTAIQPIETEFGGTRCHYFIEKDGIPIRRVAMAEELYTDSVSKTSFRKVIYYFNGVDFSEKEALKIIRIKAFI